MTLRIKLKNSVVKDKAPVPGDLEVGELAINAHQDSPAAYIKDAAGAVRKIAGVGSVSTPAASDTVQGIVELATAAEVTTGIDATRAVTPAGLKVELDKKAPLASPALTGTPTAPTAAVGTNTTQLATTAFVGAAVTAGTPAATTAASGLVQLADAAAVTAGTAGRVVDAAQLKAAVAAEDLWDRAGTEISPKTAGDSVFTSGAVKVGGTSAAPNIQLKADGSATFKKNVWVSSPTGTEATIALNQTSIQAWEIGMKAGDSSLSFSTLGTHASRKAELSDSGDFLFGGTLPASPNIKLGANGVIDATTYRLKQNNVTVGYYAYDSKGGLPTQGQIVVSNFGNNGASSPHLATMLSVGATAWTPYTSESRLKDIQSDADADQCWNLVRDIELKRYYYKDQDDKSGVSYMGPMADWLGLQDPELLIDTGRTDEHGKIHTYNQGLLDMKALAALSAALKRIEDLEADVAALKGTAPHKQADPGAK